MRQAAKRDENEAGIILALEAAGATVQQLSMKDVPDLLVGYHGQNFIMEVKNTERHVAEDKELSAGQERWISRWMGYVWIVHNPEEALRAIGANPAAPAPTGTTPPAR